MRVDGDVARSERFELPTLGIEIRCSIQLSYERVPGPIIRLGPIVPACGSEAGVAAAVLAEIRGRALVAAVGRRAVVIGEGAGGEARAVIVQVADLVGQRIGPVIAVVMARFGKARGDGHGHERGGGGEQLQSGHHVSPVSLLKTKTFWPVWAPS